MNRTLCIQASLCSLSVREYFPNDCLKTVEEPHKKHKHCCLLMLELKAVFMKFKVILVNQS